MAITVKKEFVLEAISKENLPFYVISDGRNVIAENQEINDCETARSQVEEILGMVDDASVIITLSELNKKEVGKGGAKGSKRREFRVMLKSKTNEGVQGATSREFALMETIANLRVEIVMLKNQHALELLTIKHESNKEQSPWMNIAMQGLAGLLNPQKPGIAGHNDPHVEPQEIKMSSEAKVKKALSILNKIDQNLPDTLLRLAEFAERDPNKYNSLLPLLNTL